MHSNPLRRSLVGSLSLVALVALGSPARAAAQDAGNPPADTHRDNGFDKGLLGLLGLAGLLGLRRRDEHRATRNDAPRATTSRV